MEIANTRRGKRSSNFTKEDEILLIEEVEKLKGIIECKTTDKVNNHEKNQAWIKVTASFNAKGPSHQARSQEQLKSKYENLKTKARRFAAINNKYLRGTGGGPSKEPDWDPVLESILRVINEKTVTGLQNPFDSDQIYDPINISVTEMEKENIELEQFVLIEPNEENEVPTNPRTLESFDNVVSDSVLTTKIADDVELKSNHQAAEIEILSSNDWSNYTPRRLKTPINKKLRQQAPVSSALQNAKTAYYLKKAALLDEEIKQKKIAEEDNGRKRLREEKEHELKIKILCLELKLKEKQLNSSEN